METITDPRSFTASEIVEKNNRTGIFSNKRLLVIGTGHLYYYSTVPKNYKRHSPKLLQELTELPKCAVEIRKIIEVTTENNKSTNLFLTFLIKDMLDRDEIKKTITLKKEANNSERSNSEILPPKNGQQKRETWVFTFTTSLQCRLWLNALNKLRVFFQTEPEAIVTDDFVANFDPQIRMSQAKQEERGRANSQIKVVSNLIAQQSIYPHRHSQMVSNEAGIGAKSPKSAHNDVSSLIGEGGSVWADSNASKRRNQSLPASIPEKVPNINEGNSQSLRRQAVSSGLFETPPNQNNNIGSISSLSILSATSLPIISQNQEIYVKRIEDELRGEIRQEMEAKYVQQLNELRKKTVEKRTDQFASQTDIELPAPITPNKQGFQSGKTKGSSHLSEPSDHFKAKNEGQIGGPFGDSSFVEQMSSIRQTPTKAHLSLLMNRQTSESTWSLDQLTKAVSPLEAQYDFYYQVGQLFMGAFTQRSERQIKFTKKLKLHQERLVQICRRLREQMVEEDRNDESRFSLQNYSNQLNQKDRPSKIVNIESYSICLERLPGRTLVIDGKQQLCYNHEPHQKALKLYLQHQNLQKALYSCIKKAKDFVVRVPITYLIEEQGVTCYATVQPHCKPVVGTLPLQVQEQVSILRAKSQTPDDEKWEILQIIDRPKQLYLIRIKTLSQLFPKKVISSKSSLNDTMNMTFTSLPPEQPSEEIQFNTAFPQETALIEALKTISRHTEPFTTYHQNALIKTALSNPGEVLAKIVDTPISPPRGIFYRMLFNDLGVVIQSKISNWPPSREQLNDLHRKPVVKSYVLLTLEVQRLFKSIAKLAEKPNRIDLVKNVLFLSASLDGQNSPQHQLRVGQASLALENGVQSKDSLGSKRDCLHRLKELSTYLPYYNEMAEQCNSLLVECYSKLLAGGERDLLFDALSHISKCIDYQLHLYGSQSESLSVLAAQTVFLYSTDCTSALQMYEQAIKFSTHPQILIESIGRCTNANRSEAASDLIGILGRVTAKIEASAKTLLARVHFFLGLLNLQIKCSDRAISHLQKSYELFVSRRDHRQSNKLVECVQTLLKTAKTSTYKRRLYQSFRDIVSDWLDLDPLPICTHIVFDFISRLSESERGQFGNKVRKLKLDSTKRQVQLDDNKFASWDELALFVQSAKADGDYTVVPRIDLQQLENYLSTL